MPTTIRDIAKMAGVCIGTVSRVINNKDKVDDATRKRILALIQQTGYRPSAIGRSLALRKTNMILLGVFNIADPYCARLLKDVAKHCREFGYSTLLGDADQNPALEAEYLRRLQDGRVDGAIVSAVPTFANKSLFAQLVAARFPLVLMDNHVPTVRANCVKYDDFGGAKAAMKYLFGKGHTRIAFCGRNMDFQTVKERHEAYVQAHKARGLTSWRHCSFAVAGGVPDRELAARLERLLRQPNPPTAILAENETMAIACIHTAQRLKLRVPDDVAVLSFGSAASSVLEPMPLTSISLHPEKAAEAAVHLLFDLIAKPERCKQPARTIIIQPELVIGESA